MYGAMIYVVTMLEDGGKLVFKKSFTDFWAALSFAEGGLCALRSYAVDKDFSYNMERREVKDDIQSKRKA